jgi:hypothetical protein
MSGGAPGTGAGEAFAFPAPGVEGRLGLDPGARGMGFSATTVSSMPVGAPTLRSTESFWWRYFASASNLKMEWENETHSTYNRVEMK